MDTADVLIKARKLLSDPRRWGKGRFAKPTEDGGECFCALGAIAAVTCGLRHSGDCDFSKEPVNTLDPTYRAAATKLAATIEKKQGYWGHGSLSSVWTFNDQATTKYEDVLERFSDAIQEALAEREQETAA